MTDSAAPGKGTGFFSNLIGCFTLDFYRKAASYPLTKAFLHVAGLCAILSVFVIWIAVWPQYKEYEEEALPKLRVFFEEGIDKGIFFEEGKVVYEDVEGYEDSITINGEKIGIIVDPEGKIEEIPEGYTDVVLFTGEKLLAGSAKKNTEGELPEERTSARKWIVERKCASLGTAFLVSAWTEVFTAFFALSAVVIGLCSVAVFGAVGRHAKELRLSGQLSICAFASTPLIVGLIAASGVIDNRITYAIIGVTGAIFLLLAVTGTMTVGKKGIIRNEKPDAAGDSEEK